MYTSWRAIVVFLILAATQMLSHAKPGNVVLASASDVALEPSRSLIVLEPTDVVAPNQLNSYLTNSSHKIYVVLRGPEATEQPGVLYNLYLDLPEGSAPGKEDVHFIDSLNFYGAVRLEGAASSGENSFRSYEITGVIKNLAAGKLLTKATTITIIPAGIPAANAKPKIQRIDVVEQ